MTVQINTDHNIEENSRLDSYITEKIKSTLKRFSDHITRIEVYLSDQNADKKSKDDHKCRLEVRLEGMTPISVMKKANNVESSINGAVGKMNSLLKKHFDKLN